MENSETITSLLIHVDTGDRSREHFHIHPEHYLQAAFCHL